MTRVSETVNRLFAGLAVAVIFLFLCEGGLRLLPLERWERGRLMVSEPLFIPGEGAYASRYVTNPHFQGAMSFQAFPRVKPQGVKRVFVLGGSAALGWPGPNPAAFSGYIQRALDQVLPGRFEIVSAAAMSYGSHRVLDLLADVVQFEPDAVIIWSGNNEFVERNALPPYIRSRIFGGLRRGLEKSSLYRGVRLLLGAVAPTWFALPQGGDITDLRQAPQVRRGMLGRSIEVNREIQDNYRRNLTDMARLIRASGAAGIFCTVPVNLSAWRPYDALPIFPDTISRDHWQELRGQAAAHWENGDYVAATGVLERLLSLTPDYAFGHFLLGDALRRLQRFDRARSELAKACELDPRPLRALPSFRAIVTEVAQQEGMQLADLAAAFRAESGNSLVGLDLFQDYVHPTAAGNQLAAQAVFAALQQAIAPDLDLATLNRAVAKDDWVPRHFVWKADAAYVEGMTCQNNGDDDCAERAYLSALREDPGFAEPAGNLGLIYEGRGDLARARFYLEVAMKSDPGSVHGVNLARILYRQGESSRAKALADQLLHDGLVDAELFRLLGTIADDENRLEEAKEYYLKAIEYGSENPELLKHLSLVQRRLGLLPQAAGTAGRAPLQ